MLAALDSSDELGRDPPDPCTTSGMKTASIQLSTRPPSLALLTPMTASMPGTTDIAARHIREAGGQSAAASCVAR